MSGLALPWRFWGSSIRPEVLRYLPQRAVRTLFFRLMEFAPASGYSSSESNPMTMGATVSSRGNADMRVREVFAHNLRRLCENEQSIAHVCRSIGIKPQQIQGYLSGRHFPNERMLDKICGYFEIDELSLFTPVQNETNKNENDNVALKKFEDIARKNPYKINLDDGLYSVYFSTLKNRKNILKSIMAVRSVDGLKTFRRVTSYYKRDSPVWAYFRGNHFGVILQAGNTIFFNSLNSISVFEPSLMAVEWFSSSEPILHGKALITGFDGPTFSAVVIAPEKGVALRKLLKGRGSLNAGDREIPEIVAALLGSTLDELKRKTEK